MPQSLCIQERTERRREAEDADDEDPERPSRTFSQVASSKSARKTFAPELRALIIIFRSTGPVISTRRFVCPRAPERR
jgi:hypothetical protein